MANVFDFSSDKIDIYLFLVDSSSSMQSDSDKVREGLKLYKKSFENFPESNSIAVSLCRFDNSIYCGDFKKVGDFDTSYYTGGTTAIYYSIGKAAQYLKNYIKEVTERTGCIPRATMLVLSDGLSCDDKASESSAQCAIQELNLAGITTVFVAFGDAITSEFGKRLGFVSTIDVQNRDTLVNFLGVELSKSCKEQSQSLKALGANFFSHAVDESNSDKYSNTTAQALEDDSWINDI